MVGLGGFVCDTVIVGWSMATNRNNGVGPSSFTAPGSSGHASSGGRGLPGVGSLSAFGSALSAGLLRGMPPASSGSRRVASASEGSSPTASRAVYVGPYADRKALGEPFAVWLGMVGLLVLLGWFSNHDETLGGVSPAHVKIGGYNFLAVGVTAAVFIALLKILANKYPFPGFTEFSNAL